MNKCKQTDCSFRKYGDFCRFAGISAPFKCNDWIPKITNGDRLRLMSDEVLARYIDVNMLPDRFLTDHYMKERAIDVILEWLKQEVEE